VENFPVVQPAILASIVRVEKSALLRAFLQHFRVKPRTRMTALQQTPAHLSAQKSRATAEKKRPDRGDNRSGQSHMGAWGGWALAPNTANGEG
jgi:hypothetical protein